MSTIRVCSCLQDSNVSCLSDDQLRYFKERLLLWRTELCDKIRWNGDSLPDQGLSDWLDVAAVNAQVELSMVERQRSWQLIRQIDAALERIADGTYGFCSESGAEIGIKRLKALPTAQYSVDIQNDIEQRKRRWR